MNKFEKWKRSQEVKLLRKCARAIANGEQHWCCTAITKMSKGNLKRRCLKHLNSAMENRGPVSFGSSRRVRNRENRIMALLFTAEMVRSQDV